MSHYVRPGSALDTEATARGNSVYFPRRVIPMLPEKISNGLCSLNPDVDRLAMVCDAQIDANGDVTKYRFYPAVFRSRARLTYNQVWSWLSGEAQPLTPAHLAIQPQLHTLYVRYSRRYMPHVSSVAPLILIPLKRRCALTNKARSKPLFQ